MKIGIDARAAKWYRGTGIGTYTYQLVNSLNKIDYLNQYLIFMPKSSTYDIKFNSNYKIKNVTQDMKGEFWNEINIPNVLQNKDIDLYHVPQNGVGLPKDKNSPFVITLHDVIPCKMPETVGKTYLEIFKRELPNIISRCDGILTVSNYSKQDIIRTFNFPEEKIFVTHLANEDIYFPRDKNMCKNFLSKHYNINDNYILYVGGFSPRKNIVGLIEAFSKLNYCDLKLIIVGRKGKSYEIYKSTAERLHVADKVIFPGFIPLEHMPIFYSACEVFVYPSLYEGFGLPPIEAMASGVPIIASNLTSIPEVVGNAALLINPYNIDELYEAMKRVLEDPLLKANLINKSLIRSSKFSWLKTAQETVKAFETIAGYKR